MSLDVTLQALRSALDPSYPLFVVVDPMLADPLVASTPDSTNDLQAQREAFWQRPVARIPLHKRIPLKPHQHPYLVELQGLDDPFVQSTLELAHSEHLLARKDGFNGTGSVPHRIGGWVQSSLFPEQLAEVISKLMRLSVEIIVSQTYLRLADRRVLALLRCVLGDARVGAAFGRLQAWAYLDARASLAVLRSTGEDASGSLQFSVEEWAAMQWGGQIHPCVAMALGVLNEGKQAAVSTQTVVPSGSFALQSCAVPELYQLARKSVEAADQAARRWPRRFLTPHDQVVWAGLCLLHPVLCQGIPAAVEALMDAVTQGEPPDAVRYLHRHIRAELNRRETPDSISSV